MAQHVDKELEQFRSLMEVPSTFEEGFNWKALFGALFIALLMVPGGIYISLLIGSDLGAAAQWVTVILFVEVARRAQQSLKKAEIFILFFMASFVMAMPFSGLLWNQFFIRSQAAQATGIASQIPAWIAPALSSASYAQRSFFSLDWLPVLGFIAFTAIFGSLSNMVLGYGLFRVTSDIEKLPFPMAPVGAQGILALAEDVGENEAKVKEKGWRWRVFSIGSVLGIAFGAVYILVPIITSAMTNGNPIQLFNIPFVDTTGKTQAFLPAVATGLSWDATHLMLGMVLPFFAVIGSAIGLLLSVIANPILYHAHVLAQWAPGDDTIITIFKNNVDFYFSFGIGVALSVALVGGYQAIKGIREHRKTRAKAELHLDDAKYTERGDIKPKWILLCYFAITVSYILLSGYLINWHPGVMLVLLFFGFVYTPIISYVTARLEGMAGQYVEIPMIKEAALIMSGYPGAAIWFLPIPIANYGAMTVFYRQCELTGTKFSGIWKSQLILFPVILVSSFLFMNFIWGMAPVPSAMYPFANKMWELNAANQCVIYTSTTGEYSYFQEAFKPLFVLAGAGVGVVLFSGLSLLGAPIFLVYGLVRGLGNPMPHYLIPQLTGALLGRFYFQKRLGLKWREYVPVVFAGFSCGMGLITTLGVGIQFLSKAAIQLPF